MTMTLFTIISTYSLLAEEKSGGTIDRVTADLPYNEGRCTGGVTVLLLLSAQSFGFPVNPAFLEYSHMLYTLCLLSL